MTYSTYIFDFDYTLADATYGIVNCFYYSFDMMNINRPEFEDVRKCIGMTLADSFIKLTGNSNAKDIELFLKYYRTKADEIMTKNTVILPHTKSTLETLYTNGKKVAIVTTKRRIRIVETLKNENLSHTVSVIIGGDDVKNAKPDPTGLLTAIEMLNEAKENVLYVGDSTIDCMTAENAGVDFCAVLTGTTTRDEFEKLPHKYIFNSLAEIINIY